MNIELLKHDTGETFIVDSKVFFAALNPRDQVHYNVVEFRGALYSVTELVGSGGGESLAVTLGLGRNVDAVGTINTFGGVPVINFNTQTLIGSWTGVTQLPGTSNTTIATTAFVTNALSSQNELAEVLAFGRDVDVVGTINDFSSVVSINANTRTLANSAGIATIDWENTLLSDSLGVNIFYWSASGVKLGVTKYFTDFLNFACIDPNARVLIDSTGVAPSLDWTSRILYNNWIVTGNFSGQFNNVSDLGTPTEGWANLYMASNIHYTTNLAFKNATVTKMTLTTGGRLGIGAAIPDARLHVIGEGITSATMTLHLQNSGLKNITQLRDDGQIIIGISSTATTANDVVIGRSNVGGNTFANYIYGFFNTAISDGGVCLYGFGNTGAKTSIAIGDSNIVTGQECNMGIGQNNTLSLAGLTCAYAYGKLNTITHSFSAIIGDNTSSDEINAFYYGRSGYIFKASQTELLSAAAEVIINGGLNNSPTFKLRAKYDSDPGAGVVSTTYDFTVQNVMLTGGLTPTSRVDMGIAGLSILNMLSTGNVGLQVSAPTARLHIAAGTAVADTAPIKFIAVGSALLAAVELGSFEFVDNGVTGNLYITVNIAGVPTRVLIV